MHPMVFIEKDNGDYVDYNPAERGAPTDTLGERIRLLPEDKGKGYFSTVSIRKSLGTGISRCKFEKDYSAKITWPRPVVCFGFCLSGHTLSRNSCHPTPIVMTPGRSYVHFFEDPVFERKTKGQQELRALVVRVFPEYLFDLLDLNQEYENQFYNSFVEKLRSGNLFEESAVTPEMKEVIFQIFNNTHSGHISRLYLEGKVLELIAFMMERMTTDSSYSKKPYLMSLEDKERIYYARELLLGDLQFPPSLCSLAKQVGMSHTRLNRGFKKIFGRTVFEYLRKERLVHARKLIEENPVDLTRIALESGFCSSSHLAINFTREYGIRPSEYRRSLFR